jgi:ABC-type molybdenum transport system ATPase subunit/photorepair protein PhrA
MSELVPAIELINVDVTGAELRSDTVMIKNVNWTINTGDYWVVGGLPGTGKTDLLTTAAALQRPGSGTHLVFGRDIYRLDEGERRHAVSLSVHDSAAQVGPAGCFTCVAPCLALHLRPHERQRRRQSFKGSGRH